MTYYVASGIDVYCWIFFKLQITNLVTYVSSGTLNSTNSTQLICSDKMQYGLLQQMLWCWYDVQEMLKPLVEIALQISQLRELTGRNEPNVIT